MENCLPSEIWVHIFIYVLSTKQNTNIDMRLVCKRFYGIFNIYILDKFFERRMDAYTVNDKHTYQIAQKFAFKQMCTDGMKTSHELDWYIPEQFFKENLFESTIFYLESYEQLKSQNYLFFKSYNQFDRKCASCRVEQKKFLLTTIDVYHKGYMGFRVYFDICELICVKCTRSLSRLQSQHHAHSRTCVGKVDVYKVLYDEPYNNWSDI